MIWAIRLYLLFMAVIYGLIGVWALLSPIFQALEVSYPSIYEVIGLSATCLLGYSEIAGIYGGLNLCIGFMCLIGIFKKNVGMFAIKFITFLVGSIALGRVLFSLIPTTPSFFNEYFIFEVSAFAVGMIFIYFDQISRKN